MANKITEPTVGIDSETGVFYIEHRFGTQSNIALEYGSGIDLTSHTITAKIEEIDSAIGILPSDGYTVPTGGEVWTMTEVNGLITGVGESIFNLTIPKDLGLMGSTEEGREGEPASVPTPGNLKYYQIGILIVDANGFSEEPVGQIRLKYSVVSQ